VEDPAYRAQLQENARTTVRDRFSVERWNAGLGRVFEQALSGGA